MPADPILTEAEIQDPIGLWMDSPACSLDACKHLADLIVSHRALAAQNKALVEAINIHRIRTVAALHGHEHEAPPEDRALWAMVARPRQEEG